MKRLLLAAAGACALSAGAVTYDGKVLDGEWLINGSEDVIVNGTVSGTGDIRFQQTSVGAEQLADCTFENLPHNTTAELKVRNGNELVLTWSKNGLILVIQ